MFANSVTPVATVVSEEFHCKVVRLYSLHLTPALLDKVRMEEEVDAAWCVFAVLTEWGGLSGHAYNSCHFEHISEAKF